jgi:hypothetical protein
MAPGNCGGFGSVLGAVERQAASLKPGSLLHPARYCTGPYLDNDKAVA